MLHGRGEMGARPGTSTHSCLSGPQSPFTHPDHLCPLSVHTGSGRAVPSETRLNSAVLCASERGLLARRHVADRWGSLPKGSFWPCPRRSFPCSRPSGVPWPTLGCVPGDVRNDAAGRGHGQRRPSLPSCLTTRLPRAGASTSGRGAASARPAPQELFLSTASLLSALPCLVWPQSCSALLPANFPCPPSVCVCVSLCVASLRSCTREKG